MQPRKLNPWLVLLLSCVASAVALAQQAQQPSLSELEIADKLRIALQRTSPPAGGCPLVVGPPQPEGGRKGRPYEFEGDRTLDSAISWSTRKP